MNPYFLLTPPASARLGRSFLQAPRSVVSWLLLSALLAGSLAAPLVQAEDSAPERVQVVNINTADAEQLAMVLKGVGQARAEAIVRYREMYGPFETIEELLEVSGVGESTLAANRQSITLE